MCMQLFQVRKSPFDPFVSTTVTSSLPSMHFRCQNNATSFIFSFFLLFSLLLFFLFAFSLFFLFLFFLYFLSLSLSFLLFFFCLFSFFSYWRWRDGAEVRLVHAAALVLRRWLAAPKAEHRCCRSCRVPVTHGLPERFLCRQHPLSATSPGQPHHGLLRDVRQPDHGPGSLMGSAEAPVPLHTVLHCEDLVWLIRSLLLLLCSSSSSAPRWSTACDTEPIPDPKHSPL